MNCKQGAKLLSPLAARSLFFCAAGLLLLAAPRALTWVSAQVSGPPLLVLGITD